MDNRVQDSGDGIMPDEKSSGILIGCSGFRYPQWRGTFYPSSARPIEMLGFYVSIFRTLEINGAYYGFLRSESLAHWSALVPPGFLFSLKVPRYLTRLKSQEDIASGWKQVFHMIEPLKRQGILGALLVQIPASVERNMDLLKGFLNNPLEEGIDLAFEFKHPSWYKTEVMDLLALKGVDAATSGRSGTEPFLDVLAEHKYIRLHGAKPGGNSDHSFKELTTWGERILRVHEKARRVYVYFNNHGKGWAPVNAKTLIQRILKESSGS